MSQADIFNFLKANKPRKYLASEIVEELNMSKSRIANNLKRLRKDKGIKFDEQLHEKRHQYRYIYWCE